MVTLSSADAVIGDLARAGKIAAQAYTLHGPILYALEAAARRGANVVVVLEGRPYDNPHLAKENGRVVNQLRAVGVDARLGDPIHAKEIRADGTLYLDDKNFGQRDLILRADSTKDLRSIPMIKHAALEAEAQMLRNAQRGCDPDPRERIIRSAQRRLFCARFRRASWAFAASARLRARTAWQSARA